MSISAAPNVEKDRIPEPVGYLRPEMEPGRDAWELVQRVWMTKGRFLITLPVDPIAIAQDLGFEVLDDDELMPEASAVARKAPGSLSPQILLNPLDSHTQRRFPCALALGHCSHEVEAGYDDSWEFVIRRDLFASPQCDPTDSYATKFASELLIPRSALQEFSDTHGILALAATFGVTGDVMGFRLRRIGTTLR
jgi:hypothetical protein